MRKYLIVLFVVSLFFDANSQKYQIGIFGGTYWDSGLESFLDVNNTFTSSRTFFKSQFGVEVKRKFHRNFSLVGAYNFAYSYLQVSLLSSQPEALYTGTKIFAHSIPVLMDYSIDLPKFPGRSISLRVGLGAEIFQPQYTVEFGSYVTETVLFKQFRYGLYYTLYPPQNPVPFVQAYIGFCDKFCENKNIRIGLGYKLLLLDFKHEIYHYFNDFSSPAVITTRTNSTKVSYLTLDICYSFDLKNRN